MMCKSRNFLAEAKMCDTSLTITWKTFVRGVILISDMRMRKGSVVCCTRVDLGELN